MKDRARILITEAEEIPDRFPHDKIILMEKGEILFQGAYANFKEKYMRINYTQNLNGNIEDKLSEE